MQPQVTQKPVLRGAVEISRDMGAVTLQQNHLYLRQCSHSNSPRVRINGAVFIPGDLVIRGYIRPYANRDIRKSGFFTNAHLDEA
jgi:hypothetical protein